MTLPTTNDEQIIGAFVGLESLEEIAAKTGADNVRCRKRLERLGYYFELAPRAGIDAEAEHWQGVYINDWFHELGAHSMHAYGPRCVAPWRIPDGLERKIIDAVGDSRDRIGEEDAAIPLISDLGAETVEELCRWVGRLPVFDDFLVGNSFPMAEVLCRAGRYQAAAGLYWQHKSKVGMVAAASRIPLSGAAKNGLYTTWCRASAELRIEIRTIALDWADGIEKRKRDVYYEGDFVRSRGTSVVGQMEVVLSAEFSKPVATETKTFILAIDARQGHREHRHLLEQNARNGDRLAAIFAADLARVDTQRSDTTLDAPLEFDRLAGDYSLSEPLLERILAF